MGRFACDFTLEVDILLVSMGLSMSIILMNILIGVLGESYNRGALTAEIGLKSGQNPFGSTRLRSFKR